MSNCYKPADVVLGCESSDLQLQSGVLLIDIRAFKPEKATPSAKFTLSSVKVVDPDTGAYPLPASDYYPIKMEWAKNAVKANYEVNSSEFKNDTYTQTLGQLVIANSETATGKENILALSTRKYVAVASLGTSVSEDSKYQVYGSKNGLQFLVEPTSDDYGGRVLGTLRSLTGGGEPTPNGLNLYRSGDMDALDIDFNNRFEGISGE